MNTSQDPTRGLKDAGSGYRGKSRLSPHHPPKNNNKMSEDITFQLVNPATLHNIKLI